VASYLLRFAVPPVPPEFEKRPPGWGALVLEFNGPAAGTGLLGAKFEFKPECPVYAPGIPDDLSSDFPRIQLGPGNYRLGATGTKITRPDDNPHLGKNYGFFNVIVEYDPTAAGAPPMVVSGFWQNKLTSRGVRIFTFDPDADIPAVIPNPVFIPEPSTFALAALGGLGLVGVLRRRRTPPARGA
jgi:hypothetical protein